MKKWCRQILKGLAYLHNRNPPVIHRDLKCDNVFISSTTGCVKIGDLGLATFKTQTFAKSMRGTMEFMAPEMFDERYDELVDVYSFGLCMLEMITGEYPYIECKGPTAVIKRVTAGLKPDCYYKVQNEDVREVIDCCIRTKKEERLSAQDLLQHSFFLDGNGIRIDFVRDRSNDLQVVVEDDSIVLKLKIIDKAKRKVLWDTEHEALRFQYNFTSDTPEKIVDELIKQKKIFDDDKKFVIQSIKDRLRAYQYEQIDRQAGVFSRERKPTTTQSSITSQQQQQVPPPQQQTQIIAQPQVAPVIPTPSVIQQTSMEVHQQIVKTSSEIPQTKPIATTEPIPIALVSELSSSVSGSAGSLEILNEALKKTFNNKTNAPQTASTPSTITNDISDLSTPVTNQDESSTSKVGNDTTIIDQQPTEESGASITGELTTSK
jgi:serine/threonine protein kinase